MSNSNKRPAQTPAYMRTGGKAPRSQLENAAGGAASPEGALSNNTVMYDALKKGAEAALFLWRVHVLHHGTEAQVDEAIGSFFRTDEGKKESCAYAEDDDGDILDEMKEDMEKLGVPKERCFFINDELDDEYCRFRAKEPDTVNYWHDPASKPKKGIARLAWLMQRKDDA